MSELRLGGTMATNIEVSTGSVSSSPRVSVLGALRDSPESVMLLSLFLALAVTKVLLGTAPDAAPIFLSFFAGWCIAPVFLPSFAKAIMVSFCSRMHSRLFAVLLVILIYILGSLLFRNDVLTRNSSVVASTQHQTRVLGGWAPVDLGWRWSLGPGEALPGAGLVEVNFCLEEDVPMSSSSAQPGCTVATAFMNTLGENMRTPQSGHLFIRMMHHQYFVVLRDLPPITTP